MKKDCLVISANIYAGLNNFLFWVLCCLGGESFLLSQCGVGYYLSSFYSSSQLVDDTFEKLFNSAGFVACGNIISSLTLFTFLFHIRLYKLIMQGKIR